MFLYFHKKVKVVFLYQKASVYAQTNTADQSTAASSIGTEHQTVTSHTCKQAIKVKQPALSLSLPQADYDTSK